MSDECHVHKCPLGECGIRCIHAAIDGREVFAWWPVPIHNRGGWHTIGVAWLTTVIKRRRIGFPSYYYNRTEASQ